jgi:hypothetical protein
VASKNSLISMTDEDEWCCPCNSSELRPGLEVVSQASYSSNKGAIQHRAVPSRHGSIRYATTSDADDG